MISSDSSSIPQSNQGTASFSSSATSMLGTWRFSLSCSSWNSKSAMMLLLAFNTARVLYDCSASSSFSAFKRLMVSFCVLRREVLEAFRHFSCSSSHFRSAMVTSFAWSCANAFDATSANCSWLAIKHFSSSRTLSLSAMRRDASVSNKSDIICLSRRTCNTNRLTILAFSR